MNPCNNGTLTGRVSREPITYTNNDGSKAIVFDLAVRDNYPTAEVYRVHFFTVRVFIPPERAMRKSPWQAIPKGTLLSLNFELKTKETGGGVGIESRDPYPTFLESSAVRKRRRQPPLAAEFPDTFR